VTRLPKFGPTDLTTDQRALYEAISQGPRSSGPFPLTDDAGRLNGPFNAMLLSPELGTALQQLGEAIRYRGELDDRCREIAILTVASVWDSAFERFAHESVASAIGMTSAELDALRGGSRAPFQGVEGAVAHFAYLLADRRSLTDDEYDEATSALGPSRLFELTTLVGYYSTLALQLRVFGDEIPAEG